VTGADIENAVADHPAERMQFPYPVPADRSRSAPARSSPAGLRAAITRIFEPLAQRASAADTMEEA
jgi:hypothetical protein